MNDFIAANKDALGIHQYAFLTTDKISFSPDVRKLCEVNACGLYGKTWACPPGVGPLEDCIARIRKYENIFVFTTLHQLEDSFDYEGMMSGRDKHNDICPTIAKVFSEKYDDMLVLSGEGCSKCSKCTYPDAPCRFPEKAVVSVEACGIHVVNLSKNIGIKYNNGANTVTYFCVVLFSEAL